VHFVHLPEEKVFAQFSKSEDMSIRRTVRFGDDSVAEIEVHGMVVFKCRNGEERICMKHVEGEVTSRLVLGRSHDDCCLSPKQSSL
jgi:hypothetical protein